MYRGATVAVVVPAYNEAALIERTLTAVPDWVDHVVVVDDASRDETRQRVADVADDRVLLLRHEVNQGVGASIGAGYAVAFERGADVAIVMAGDAQMDAADLPALLSPVLTGLAGYAKGDRLSHPDVHRSMPVTRRVGNIVLSWLTRLATGLRVNDSQCGYTALTRSAAERLCLVDLWPRYGYPNDLLGRLSVAGVSVADVVVRPIYGEERSGIGLRHALFVVPFVLGRVMARRLGSFRIARRPRSAGMLPAPRTSR